MKQLTCILLVSVLAITSCKKKENTPATSSNTGGGTGGTPTMVLPVYDALFEMNDFSAKIGGSFSLPTMNNRAILSSQTVTNEAFYNLLNMGTVKINTITLANHSGSTNFYYTDTTFQTLVAPYTWSVSGSTNFTAASFQNTNAFPVFTNYNSLPDSVSKSVGFTINLSGVSNCDFIECFVIGGSGSSFVMPKYVAGNAGSISFSAADLNGQVAGNGYLSIKFCNDAVQTMNGKQVNVRSAISYAIVNFKLKP